MTLCEDRSAVCQPETAGACPGCGFVWTAILDKTGVAAQEDRCGPERLDVRMMTAYAYARIADGLLMAGVFAVSEVLDHAASSR